MADKLEIDLVIKALSEGFEKVSGDLNKLGESTKAPAEPAKKTTLSFTELKSALDLVGTAAQKTGQAFKAAFDFAQLGATVIQTESSFNNLISTIGAAPNLLQQLQDASGGTIDKLSLMSSTATLLAGTSGTLATSLANATPQLLEIARAANKLNPALGDTAFLYESISKGIKRASPMILDNLGIVVKVGEANRKYAEALGITEQQMTAADKQQALLNATLQAGGVLIEQAGGAAGNAVDDFSAFTTSIKNLKNEFAAWVASTKTIQQPLNNLTTQFTAWSSIFDALNSGLITGGEAFMLFNKAATGTGTANDVIQEMGDKMRFTAGATLAFSDAMQDHATYVDDSKMSYDALGEGLSNLEDMYSNQHIAIQESIGDFEAQAAAQEAAAQKMSKWNTEAANMIQLARDAKPPVDEMLESISQDISSPLEAFISDLQFFIASGGQDFQAAFQKIKDALANNEISAEDAAGLSATLLAEIENVKVAMGEITFADAAANLADTLNIPLKDAVALLNEVKTKKEEVSETNATILDSAAVEELHANLLAAEGDITSFKEHNQTEMDIIASDMEVVVRTYENLASQIEGIEGDHTVRINIETNGTIPTVGVGTNQTGEVATELATGGIIPGSYSQPVPVVAHGSEMVLNPDQQNNLFNLLNSGGGMAGNSSIYVILDGQQIAAAIETRSGQRARQVSGAYRP